MRPSKSPYSAAIGMTITKQTISDKIAAYLHHDITQAQLVDWAEHGVGVRLAKV